MAKKSKRSVIAKHIEYGLEYEWGDLTGQDDNIWCRLDTFGSMRALVRSKTNTYADMCKRRNIRAVKIISTKQVIKTWNLPKSRAKKTS